jgi:hypothetical protein
MDDSFPGRVVEAITAPTHAVYHLYAADGAGEGGGEGGKGEGGGQMLRHTIHAVGPNFNQGDYTWTGALHLLADTYANTLTQFALTPSDVTTLRLLPISGGIFAGPFKPRLVELTRAALAMGFAKLSPAVQRVVVQRRVQMCVFEEQELRGFMRVFPAPSAMRLAPDAPSSSAGKGSLRSEGGGEGEGEGEGKGEGEGEGGGEGGSNGDGVADGGRSLTDPLPPPPSDTALAALPTRHEQLHLLEGAAVQWKRQHPGAGFEQWLQQELVGSGSVFSFDCMGNLDWTDSRNGTLRMKFCQRQMRSFDHPALDGQPGPFGSAIEGGGAHRPAALG